MKATAPKISMQATNFQPIATLEFSNAVEATFSIPKDTQRRVLISKWGTFSPLGIFVAMFGDANDNKLKRPKWTAQMP